MNFLKKYGFYLLLLGISSEIMGPFILGLFYPNYDHLTMLISTFGEPGSPVQLAFKIWAITDGVLIVLSAPAFYDRFKGTSEKLSRWVAILVAAFGIGDCIITGVVDRAKHAGDVDFFSLLHNYASGAGFVALLIGTALLWYLYRKEGNRTLTIALPIIFLFSLFFMILFATPKIPLLDQLQVTHRGLWQRANLFFLYLPYFVIAWKNRKLSK